MDALKKHRPTISWSIATIELNIENDNIIKQNTVNEEMNGSPSSSSNPATILNKYKDWGSLRNSQKNCKDLNYLDACSDWDYVQSHKAIEMPVLKNGNLCDSILVDGTCFCKRNMCP